MLAWQPCHPETSELRWPHLSVSPPLRLAPRRCPVRQVRQVSPFVSLTSLTSAIVLTVAVRNSRWRCGAIRSWSQWTSAASAASARCGRRDAVARRSGFPSLEIPQSWCAVFINLARRADRRLQLAHVLAEGNSAILSRLLRVDAVDGRTLDLDNPDILQYITPEALAVSQEAQRIGAHTIVHKDGELVKFHDHLTAGGIACAMSHHKALRTVAEHPTAEWGLIMEDDIQALVPDVHEVIAKAVQRLPSNWDAVFLGYHGGTLDGFAPGGRDTEQEHTRAKFELQIDEMRGYVDEFRGSVDREELEADEVPMLRMYSPLYGLYAWAVKKEAAATLLNEAFPVGGQVDHALSLWLVQHGHCFKVAPRHLLFYSPKSEVGLDSDIQTMTHLDSLLADPEHCDRYVDFINSNQSAEDPDATA